MTDFDPTEFTTDNAELLAAADRITSGSIESTEPKIVPPEDGPVTLPGGFRRVSHGPDGVAFTPVKDAWVRELNGEDEERIDKARRMGDGADFVQTLLECGVERLGDQKPSKDELADLVVGDADYLLLEISRATFGNDLEVTDFVCPHCGALLNFTIHKDEDIPVKRVSAEEMTITVPLRKDRIATCNLPTGATQRLMLKAETEAEANTILLANCLVQIIDPTGLDTVTFGDGDLTNARKLGVADRKKILNSLDAAMPGPRYDGVVFPHPECGNDVRVAVTAADLFLEL